MNYLDIVCSILFKNDGPMNRFLFRCKNAKTGDLASAVTKALGIISVFIEERQKQFQKYADRLMVMSASQKRAAILTCNVNRK